MKIKEKLGSLVKTASGKAKYAYGHIRLDMKIKEYEKELEQTKAAIGELVYASWCSSKQVDQPALDDHFENIQTIENRLNRIKKRKEAHIEAHKEENADDTVGADCVRPQDSAFTKLKKKENDLSVGRIQGGIDILRHCPSCNTPNNPKTTTCKKCAEQMDTVGADCVRLKTPHSPNSKRKKTT